jgi:Concanavalin A-like lectin/glucanases superfamily
MATLFAAYAFNEGSGSTILDYSGNGYDLTIAGSNSWVSGKYYTYAFQPGASGSDGATWTNGSDIPALSGDISVQLWYQHTVSGDTTTSHAGGLYRSSGSAAAAAYSYRNRSGIGSSPHMTCRDSASTIIDVGVSGTVADSSWHNVAFIYAATGAMDLYLDGTLLDPAISPTTTNPIGDLVTVIGVGSVLSTALAQAAVQDMRVFDGAMAAGDVTTYMDTPVAAPPASPPGLLMASII